MSSKFQIVVKKNKGDLHVSPRGRFDGSSACELVNLIDEQYDGKCKVTIDTRNLREICPFGCSIFRSCLKRCNLPTDRLSFTGEKGYQIAPDASQVKISNKRGHCGCSADCKNCPCKKNENRN